MGCINKDISIEKRKDLAHMKIMCVYASNLADEPRGLLLRVDGLYQITPIEEGQQYLYVTAKVNNEYELTTWQP